MIDERKLAEIRLIWDNGGYTNVNALLDTLSAALRVVRAAQKVTPSFQYLDGQLWATAFRDLEEALAPFTEDAKPGVDVTEGKE